jgi:hypothetical protein
MRLERHAYWNSRFTSRVLARVGSTRTPSMRRVLSLSVDGETSTLYCTEFRSASAVVVLELSALPSNQ